MRSRSDLDVLVSGKVKEAMVGIVAFQPRHGIMIIRRGSSNISYV
jgi:hypothetical protein